MEKVRRYDLDWLRVLVFGILIFYHIGMFFIPWGWHLKNNNIYEWLQFPMTFLNQWRLPILFIISGMGTRFALASRSKGEFLTERTFRLLIPLVFGMLLVVAPQVYIERVVNGDFIGSFWQFYPSYFNGIYPSGNFSWHHLWFLPYLFVYSVILAPVFIYLRNNPEAMIISFSRAMFDSRFGLLVFLLPLFLIFFCMAVFFPTTHNLISDWYNFTFSLVLFFYGYLFISIGDIFWKRVEKSRKVALAVGIVAFPLYLLTIYQMEDTVLSWFLESITKMINLGAWIFAVFGYAMKYLSKQGKWLQYANQGVYPFYIFHQTIILIVAFYLYDQELNDFLKFLILTISTAFGCWVLFELVKRAWISRILFGIKTIR